MKNSPGKFSKPTFTIVLCFFFLFLAPMHAQQDPKPELRPEPRLEPKSNTTSPKIEPKPEPKSNATSPKTEPKPGPTSNSTSHPTGPKPEPKSSPASPKTGPKPESKSNSTSLKAEPKPESKSNSTSPKTEPKPEPKSNSASPKTGAKMQPKSSAASPKPEPKPKASSAPTKIKPTPPTTKPTKTSPYHFANHFCLSRRLDVKSTFCLQVLRSSPTSATVKDNLGLLKISADLAIQFGNKTIIFLKKLSQDKKTLPNLKPVIEECLSAYEGYITQFKLLVQEAKTEAQLASYDSELAKIEINRCVKALGETKNPDIHAQNKIALDYAKLSQNIADSID
ncbi:hypothetical protein CDL12_28797 [Handroanthus impetiginosus]|uniref:Pectinesterase inhibitor domain-containing protein n=1 Tax=Handroanthus impetiginosus TaxID=429701 RepID=A0A2G9G0B1_9LAMI|nr:hypothetical protein CDL12_28797 [Handroanthus impetiginosus]